MGINGKLTSENSERLRTVAKYLTEAHLRRSTADFSMTKLTTRSKSATMCFKGEQSRFDANKQHNVTYTVSLESAGSKRFRFPDAMVFC